ncbi:hypothetical protein J6590_060232 [Homalodisca vitripennis]|nr:hypothetical protein J6590_060232 [Homalodisca vitripennis]
MVVGDKNGRLQNVSKLNMLTVNYFSRTRPVRRIGILAYCAGHVEWRGKSRAQSVSRLPSPAAHPSYWPWFPSHDTEWNLSAYTLSPEKQFQIREKFNSKKYLPLEFELEVSPEGDFPEECDILQYVPDFRRTLSIS